MRATYHLQIEVVELELARGHDGLLRGHPEPVLIIAVYVRNASAVQLFGRSLHRFHPRGQLPCTVSPDVALSLDARLGRTAMSDFVILAIAMEEDRGTDIQRMYGTVEDHRTFSVWCGSKSDVLPLQVAELPHGGSDWTYPTPVEMQIEGQEASVLCTTDKWIGSAAWVLPAESWTGGCTFRARFLSPDRRNDWTARVNVWNNCANPA
jgi:hypothetical protein